MGGVLPPAHHSALAAKGLERRRDREWEKGESHIGRWEACLMASSMGVTGYLPPPFSFCIPEEEVIVLVPKRENNQVKNPNIIPNL